MKALRRYCWLGLLAASLAGAQERSPEHSPDHSGDSSDGGSATVDLPEPPPHIPSVEELMPDYDPKRQLPDVLRPSQTQYPSTGDILKAFREIPPFERADKAPDETPPSAPDGGV